ncbi:hypothetical protein P5G51_003815 [Virgibacillus sp. 179-BFC.A HS]|uniref:Uncharacterized protein n=1 Tax=Tigheibacillus jepli TaxID=3035914 RepID=A0ABU5CEB4_9BACI|nr:hypothetical protein [Virgibacillus sp. 179-BFC.A HS]MDY0404649.1 hypothetical protein [Virgibacillus sp. 179-BFC.A HS]
MKKIKASYVLTACLVALLIVISGCGKNTASSETSSNGYPKMTIKLSHVVAEDDPKGKMATKFKEIVEKRVKVALPSKFIPMASFTVMKMKFRHYSLIMFKLLRLKRRN